MSSMNPWEKSWWIGVPEEAYGGPPPRGRIETAYFRHEFTAECAGRMELCISAATRYRLWVNSRPVLSGPCKASRWFRYYDTVDVSGYLHGGRNIISIKVVAFPPFEAQSAEERGPYWAMADAAGPCLAVSGGFVGVTGKAHDATTGQSEWRVCLDHAIGWRHQSISHWMGSMECVQGKDIPAGWMDSPEPGGYWTQACRRFPTGPDRWGEIYPFALEPRPIPLLYEKPSGFSGRMPGREDGFEPIVFSTDGVGVTGDRAVKLMRWSKYAVELDAGELMTGYFRLHMRGGKGSRITIRYAESYAMEQGGRLVRGVRDDCEKGRIIGHEDIYYPSGADETYEPFLFRTFRFVRIEAETADEELEIYPPTYLETGYPLEVRSWIESSEGWVAPVWDICLRSLRRCMHETYEDCPYYEQMQYTLDARLEILFTYMTSADARMALRTLEDYHRSALPDGMLQSRYPTQLPQAIPTFALHWILMLDDYYLQTGDLGPIKRYRPTMDALLDYFDRKIGPMGLAENLGYWERADLADVWKEGAISPEGPSAQHNLMYAYALQKAAGLTRLTGRPGVAEEYDRRAADILGFVQSLCWSQTRGMYTEGPGFENFTDIVQAWAVLCGLVKGDRAKTLMETALESQDAQECSYNHLYYLFRALEAVDLYGCTEKYWGIWKGFLPLHLTTVVEDLHRYRSDCHAWGALPLYEFTRNILGVGPLEPGWKIIRIKPYPLSIPDASGQVVTPSGIVKVSWTNRDGEFSLEAEGPAGVPMEVVLPGGRTYAIPAGGKIMI